MDTVTSSEMELSEDGAAIIALSSKAQVTFEGLFEMVFTEEWKTYMLEDQKRLREALNTLITAGNILREKFDKDVWEGHSDGTVDDSIESIRKQREGEAPGKKAKKLSPAELLAKRMKKD